jgi:asparagine synthase (glutamine-hydrolysing)
MYLVLSEIKNKGHSKVICGDGADELFAGYNFFLRKNEKELEIELERIWKIMHFPSTKLADALGITIETPFLDKRVVDLSKNIPVNLKVRDENSKKYGKWILRKIFEDKIPKSITWRDKSAMQDGSGTSGLTGLFDVMIQDSDFDNKVNEIKNSDDVVIRTKESLHYYEIYRKYYEPPANLHSSDIKCPNCKYTIKSDSKFCQMCGSYPI